MINIAKPIIGEEEKAAVLEVLESGMLAMGPRVKAFEEAFAEMCAVKHAVATSSGTTALHVALLAHGIGPGDEVITTPFTFIASANSILFTGARPVFIDIEPDTFNLNPELIEAAITSRTKAIMPVHLFGLSCDMDPIMEIAQQHNLIVIEDACQSHGARYKGKRVGSFGTGVFSLYPTKNITSGEGGMITTSDDEIAEKCRVLRNHGMRRRYYHDELGFNFRMTDIHAAIGLEQLKKLDHFTKARQRNAGYYRENLKYVKLPSELEGCEHVFNQFTVRVEDERRDKLVDHLREHGIGSAIYYPVPVHKQTQYCDYLGYSDEYPEAEKASQEVISLPVHPGLQEDDLGKIVSVLNDYHKESRD